MNYFLSACANGDVHAARLFLDEERGDIRDCHVELVKLFLDRGADVNQATNDGQTGLHVACHHGRLEVVQLLLSRGAAINHADPWGRTVLFKACGNRSLIIVQLLLDSGADVHQATNGGMTCLHSAFFCFFWK